MTTQTQKMFQLPENVFQAMVNYIATKPYNEVNQLLTAVITTAKPVDVPVPLPAAPPGQPT